METYYNNENENDEINVPISEQWRQNYLDYYDVESNTFYAPIVIDNSNLSNRNTRFSNIVTGYIKTEQDITEQDVTEQDARERNVIENMKKIRNNYLKTRMCSNCNNCCLM